MAKLDAAVAKQIGALKKRIDEKGKKIQKLQDELTKANNLKLELFKKQLSELKLVGDEITRERQKHRGTIKQHQDRITGMQGK